MSESQQPPNRKNDSTEKTAPKSPRETRAFILGVELLAITIRNSNITGVTLPTQNNEHKTLKIKQLADDTTLFLNNCDDMNKALDIINDFSCFSETRLKEVQWKILHNIYPTSILLHKMEIMENNKCSICDVS
ncbi:uncharacterized protein LOC143299124 [Babylonia areolata]|uniref:uncharacterized protein LOC143299124 n=1 Tax=Babylonia areolata TaxID=304850 RepID=UPI003FCF0DAD